MHSRTILVVNNQTAREAYLKVLGKFGIEVDTVSTFEELYHALTQQDYSGVFVDLITKIKSPHDYAERLHGVMEQLPLIQVRWEPKTGTVKALYEGESTVEALKNFIESECIPFKPRRIRESDRRSVNFNVVFSPFDEASDEIDAQNMIQTVTIDVSVGGCFLFTTVAFEHGQKIALKIKELTDKSTITAVVRWKKDWGQEMTIPGIGVYFLKISDAQRAELTTPRPRNWA